MSDTPVYMIANLETHEDPSEYRKYEKGFFPILKKHGGSFITFDDNPKHLEGTEPRSGRMIIFQFFNGQINRYQIKSFITCIYYSF